MLRRQARAANELAEIQRERRKYILQQRAAGKTMAEIAAVLGISKQRVSWLAQVAAEEAAKQG